MMTRTPSPTAEQRRPELQLLYNNRATAEGESGDLERIAGAATGNRRRASFRRPCAPRTRSRNGHADARYARSRRSGCAVR
ncbi:hypothetical protein GDO81_004000 [Engystomops pustulosus]|uniref:Uncharacterized protein n=1 Tax=Engystomops pustulosus TaxID=76066 RepID=A0AAV6ZPT5_ENGPU|nr:hypothetical protein GDO81_004000 [Engystomops pustulosus]